MNMTVFVCLVHVQIENEQEIVIFVAVREGCRECRKWISKEGRLVNCST